MPCLYDVAGLPGQSIYQRRWQTDQTPHGKQTTDSEAKMSHEAG